MEIVIPILSNAQTATQSPPAFSWEDWYEGVGGRSIVLPEGQKILREIYEEQYLRFNGPVASERRAFHSDEEASAIIKERAALFGADIVGICEIEPSDIYQG